MHEVEIKLIISNKIRDKIRNKVRDYARAKTLTLILIGVLDWNVIKCHPSR